MSATSTNDELRRHAQWMRDWQAADEANDLHAKLRLARIADWDRRATAPNDTSWAEVVAELQAQLAGEIPPSKGDGPFLTPLGAI